MAPYSVATASSSHTDADTSPYAPTARGVTPPSCRHLAWMDPTTMERCVIYQLTTTLAIHINHKSTTSQPCQDRMRVTRSSGVPPNIVEGFYRLCSKEQQNTLSPSSPNTSKCTSPDQNEHAQPRNRPATNNQSLHSRTNIMLWFSITMGKANDDIPQPEAYGRSSPTLTPPLNGHHRPLRRPTCPSS